MATEDTAGKSPVGPTLHHLDDSQSQRILWLCEELRIAYGFEYTLVNHFRDKKTIRAPPELQKIHPLGKSPILVAIDGTVITESSVIASYLLKTYDTDGKFATDNWLRDDILVSFSGTSLGLTMTIELFVDIAVSQTPWPLSYIPKALQRSVRNGFTTAEFKKSFTYLEKELGEHDWFNGRELGRSDIIMSWPFDNIGQRGWFDLKKDFPKLGAWRERILNREAWKSAIEKGNGYNMAKL
ncbi:Glutathione S-transferase 3 [Hyphodiscus hymeniophilus]|uniref:Glutathione S-transferase 3 n=1 Tax=Hyphodiscus hymeniophilus TaxID=353542 RepID=A0A9P6VEJ7_9HELO|nr:Glutathione S-transferase 3 [Hyphodiscus hymeniophilus]